MSNYGRTKAAEDRVSHDNESAVDVEMFKTIGLYQMLRMAGPVDGDGVPTYRRVVLSVVFVAFGLLGFQTFSVYFSRVDLEFFTYMTLVQVNGLLCLYKGYVMVTNADEMCDVLRVARREFTSGSLRDPRDLRQSRSVLVLVLRTFVGLSYSTLAVWLSIPFLLTSFYVPVFNHDGTISQCRLAIYNMWYPVPEATYNWWPVWFLIYLVEAFLVSINAFLWTSFDSYLVTTSFAFNAQFNTLTENCGQIGHRQRSAAGDSCEMTEMPLEIFTKNNDTQLNHYSALIECIKDNQEINKKLKKFYDIVRPVILIQVAISSYTIAALTFLIALMFFKDTPFLSAVTLKYCSGLMSLTIELYIYCFAFNHIDNVKEELNFGLYGSNWTEMDLKFKKTLLLAMQMNSSHKLVMKATPKQIINLQMFSSVINTAYTIVSLLLNKNLSEED